jgi:Leucine-rich repeat (LRR) protein
MSNGKEMLTPQELRRAPLFTSLKTALSQPEAVYKLKLTPSNSAGLKEMPEEMQAFKNLQLLDLSGSGWIRTLPNWIGDYAHLQTLKLSEMGLTALPMSIKNLTRLEVLEVAFNLDLKDISPVFAIKSLKKLSFDCRSPLISDINHLENLEDLLINDVDDTDVIEHIYNLSHLKKLELLGENLTILKTGIASLKQLEALNLTVTSLYRLPDDFIALSHLKKFTYTGLYNIYLNHHSDNNFTLDIDWGQIFETLSKLPALKIVDLSSNSIRKYHDNIGLLTQIKSLNLDDMVRKSTNDPFPTTVENLKNLKELTVSSRDAEWEIIKNCAKRLPNTKVIIK